MKTIAIDTREPLPSTVLSEADQGPVLLTVGGSPRYLVQSVAAYSPQELAAFASGEDEDWHALAQRSLLRAYADTDSIYDEL